MTYNAQVMNAHSMTQEAPAHHPFPGTWTPRDRHEHRVRRAAESTASLKILRVPHCGSGPLRRPFHNAPPRTSSLPVVATTGRFVCCTEAGGTETSGCHQMPAGNAGSAATGLAPSGAGPGNATPAPPAHTRCSPPLTLCGTTGVRVVLANRGGPRWATSRHSPIVTGLGPKRHRPIVTERALCHSAANSRPM